MTNRGVIFDLDGTLLDTLADIAAAANRTLTAHGYPVHPLNAYRWFVGDGSAKLIERAMPIDQRSPEKIKSCLNDHLADYNRHWNVATRPYEGIDRLLALLADHGIPFAVVTNKPQEAALITLQYFFPDTVFSSINGLYNGVIGKPDPTQALEAARIMGIPAQDCLFLGDSGVDMQAARHAGMVPIGAGWGYRPLEELNRAGARCVIHHPLELTAWLSLEY